jgi:hypothetical protein
MRRSLADKRGMLLGVFREETTGESTEPGGLFLSPKVSTWLGKSIDDERLTPENFPRVLYEKTHVVVNGGEWCSDRERIRAVFSISREKLEKARDRIAVFASALRDV